MRGAGCARSCVLARPLVGLEMHGGQERGVDEAGYASGAGERTLTDIRHLDRRRVEHPKVQLRADRRTWASRRRRARRPPRTSPILKAAAPGIVALLPTRPRRLVGGLFALPLAVVVLPLHPPPPFLLLAPTARGAAVVRVRVPPTAGPVVARCGVRGLICIVLWGAAGRVVAGVVALAPVVPARIAASVLAPVVVSGVWMACVAL